MVALAVDKKLNPRHPDKPFSSGIRDMQHIRYAQFYNYHDPFTNR